MVLFNEKDYGYIGGDGDVIITNLSKQVGGNTVETETMIEKGWGSILNEGSHD